MLLTTKSNKLFSQKSSIVDVRMGSKYASVPLSLPMWKFKVNLSFPTLKFSWGKNISNLFGQELKTTTNTPPPKHSLTNTVVDHQKKCLEVSPLIASNPDLCDGSPALQR